VDFRTACALGTFIWLPVYLMAFLGDPASRRFTSYLCIRWHCRSVSDKTPLALEPEGNSWLPSCSGSHPSDIFVEFSQTNRSSIYHPKCSKCVKLVKTTEVSRRIIDHTKLLP
jgi:hypothetical protein